jgi:hypothetical protein
MKVVVVDDCSFVMENIIPFLDKDITVQTLSRTRGLWSKTFGIAYKIFNSKGDIYHVNYGLQNAWLTGKLKHLDIVHFHGSDIRWTINSKRYGWLVKYALTHATKVLYATPDLEEKIKKYRCDAIYIPTPINTDNFCCKQIYNKKPKALYFKQWYETVFPTDTFQSGDKDFSFQIDMLRRTFDLTIQERNITYCDMPKFLSGFDIFIDRFSIPSFSKTCLEAQCSGLATIDFRHTMSLNSLRDRLDELCVPDKIRQIGLENALFIKEHHDAAKIAKMLSVIYKEMYRGKTTMKFKDRILKFLFEDSHIDNPLDTELSYNFDDKPAGEVEPYSNSEECKPK